MGRNALLISVDSFNLPDIIKNGLLEKGIRSFTPPQSEALKAGVLQGNNVVVVSPTASGKSLIAELVLVNSAINGKIGVYATPLKALANEKYEEFSFWRKYGLKVGITTGDYDEPGEWLGNFDIIVATYERLDSIFRLRPSWLERMSVLVIDEFHTIGDDNRGPVVELLVVRAIQSDKQIVCLSATVGNPDELAEWLNAKLVLSNWRPVKLIEGFYSRIPKVIKFSDGKIEKVKGDLITHIVKRAMLDNYQVLFFRQSRARAESTARKIALLTKGSVKDVDKLLNRLKRESPSKAEVQSLEELIRRGTAYHHAGLSHAARKIIEEGFREGLIKFVSATPTLAAGINLPARRVLIYTKRYEGGYLRPISIGEYKQMAGRAGRPQYDPYGEAIIADTTSESEGWRYVQGSPEPVRSSLISERAMRIHLLSIISTGYANTDDELFELMKSTLAYRQLGIRAGEYAIRYTTDKLIDLGMVNRHRGMLVPTRLGSMVTRLYIDPITAVIVLDGLEGMEALPDLYYLALIAMTPDFEGVRVTKYRSLSEDAEAALEQGLIPEPASHMDYYDWLRSYKIALILKSWIEEINEDDIIERYHVGPGDLYSLVETAAWLLYAASRVCEVGKLTQHAIRLFILSKRVKHGIKEELLDLVKVPGIGRVRARILYLYGIHNVEQLAKSDPTKISRLPTFGESLAKKVVEEANKLLTSRTN